MKWHFASDNTAGVCPEAWRALERVNEGFLPSYGNDDLTKQAADRFRELFETDCEVYFVFNGTAANSLALGSLCQSYHSVVTHEKSHIEVDECGAPEFFSNGTKILLTQGENGKLDPVEIERMVTKRSDIHFPKPKVVSFSQSTELGTVYGVDEVGAVCDMARRYGLKVHMDGSRFSNAIAALKVAPKDVTWKAGVDVLCFGGTKLGMAVSEAVVFFKKDLAAEFDYRCKQAGQLASKMRFLAASWLAVFQDDVWLKHAGHANRMAKRLADGLKDVAGVKLLYPVDANAVFVEMPERVHKGLAEKGWRYYTFIGGGGARFMTSWRVTERDVDELLGDVRGFSG